MAKFQELNEYINDVLMRLISSQNICKYLKHNTDEKTDPLSMADLDESEKAQLIFKNIFPFPKLPDDQLVDASTYLTVYFDNIEKGGSVYFKGSLLTFNVICHLDKWRMPAKLRPYAIMHEIDELYNGQRTNGIGKTQFYKSKMLWINKDFAGYQIQYSLVDFS